MSISKIHILPPEIIAKIAAGEVIERPSYAVKELIENSLDAGSTYITIHIENAGIKKISITDNGQGMSSIDIQQAFKPHTTSKIVTKEDLNAIQSFGFRGEALASIAAISHMTIKSRTGEESSGTLVEVKEGKLKNISPVGIPVGTSIIINNLFYNIPARKKFFKSTATEFRNILEIITHYAIVFPHIRFFLKHNNKIIIDFPQNQDQKERIRTIIGSDIFEHLLPVTHKDSYINLSGFISKPQITTQSNSRRFIFVNNRKVSDKLISLAVKEAYGNLLEQAAYPVFILFLTIPFEVVDVNIHPRKEQVAFIDNKSIYTAITKAVSKTLTEKNITYTNTNWKNDSATDRMFAGKRGNTKSFGAKLLKQIVLPLEKHSDKALLSKEMIQIKNCYLITETKTALVLIDQHAAHERILYEKFTKAFTEQQQIMQKYILPKPVQTEQSLIYADLLKKSLHVFSSIGFDIEYFQKNTFKINAIPILFKERNLSDLLTEMLEDIAEEKDIKDIDRKSQKMLAYLACRSAIKSGDKLTKQQIKTLINDLEKTPNNETCPHGRPSKILLSINQINHMFKRT